MMKMIPLAACLLLAACGDEDEDTGAEDTAEVEDTAAAEE
tara:strand:+ start:25947 stop:26066 length:120 start_codon:yes stop_codon:yes gene_type:complete